MSRKKTSIAAAILAVCFAISAYFLQQRRHNSTLFFGQGSTIVDTDHAHFEKNSKGADPISRDTRTNTSNDADPLLLHSTESLLKQSELKRFKFSRKLENDKRVLYEFLVEAPTGDDLIEVNQSISKIKGTTADSNGNPVEWRQLLAEQYSTSLGFRYQVVTVTFPKDSTKPRYSVLGIKDGNLKTRDGGGVIPIDGKINVLAFDVTFDPDSGWRYSHLFEED